MNILIAKYIIPNKYKLYLTLLPKTYIGCISCITLNFIDYSTQILTINNIFNNAIFLTYFDNIKNAYRYKTSSFEYIFITDWYICY